MTARSADRSADRSAERRRVIDALVPFFKYPDERHVETVCDAVSTLADWRPSLGDVLGPFVDHVQSGGLSDLEEAFTRTFDINPDCALEIGWHLYGENYTRGSFLVEMREHMRTLELAESAELPDHITHVLQVLARLEEDGARELTRGHLLPALDKMRGNLPAERPHATALEAVEFVARELFGITEKLTVGDEASPYPGTEKTPPGLSSQCGGMR
ncbi:MAG: hypothetical protein GY725_27105 [bacterium]|nr:hypothetical protein [bacterium]